jgi:hypothetical protein
VQPLNQATQANTASRPLYPNKTIALRAYSISLAVAVTAVSLPAWADENLFGYVRGAETLPKGAAEAYQWFTQRSDKGAGKYRALDSKTEFEYGVTDRFQVSAELNAMSINTAGLTIDGYLPSDKKFGLRPQGVEIGFKYNFLSPAKDDFGLSALTTLEYGRLDPHSGQKKTEYEIETSLQAQKYFMEGQLVWVGNIGFRGAYEKRAAIANLPDGFDWPTDPEMELNLKLGTGLSYRFAPGWSVAAELLHETEYETEVGKERWSLFGGPTLHWAGKQWWATLTYLQQLRGGGEKYEEQIDTDLHLIEKTKKEIRLKVGYNF